MLRLEVPHCLEKWSNLIEVYQQGQFLGLVYKVFSFKILKRTTNFSFTAITCHRCEPNKKVPRPPCMQNKAFFSFQLCPIESTACYNINTGMRPTKYYLVHT